MMHQSRSPHQSEQVQIASRDYWFKAVEMLQQNWALIDPNLAGGVTVWFIGDRSDVFDQMEFPSEDAAAEALFHNGFARYADDLKFQEFIHPPQPPFSRRPHPNGPIYSSGRFWSHPA